MTCDSLVGMVQAVEHGIGAAMLLCPLADAKADLVRLAEPETALDTQVWILTHPDLRQVARIRAFSQFMFDALTADPRLVHE
jgi:DNA-binding transcriptional LysR family regulator